MTALPPFGVAAKHPRYGSGYGGSGGNYGNNDYVIALRYLSTLGWLSVCLSVYTYLGLKE